MNYVSQAGPLKRRTNSVVNLPKPKEGKANARIHHADLRIDGQRGKLQKSVGRKM